MKSVMISIQPQWCELIASGKKTVEVRKTRPKIETPIKCYIYCTNTKTMGDFILCKSVENAKLFGFNTAKGINKGFAEKEDAQLKGKVIGEFVCDQIFKINVDCDEIFGNGYDSGWMWTGDDACLSYFELDNYLQGKEGYGWHISNLVIYDEPKELSEFYSLCEKGNCRLCDWEREYDSCGCNRKKPIKRPPQSWCYVEKGGVE